MLFSWSVFFSLQQSKSCVTFPKRNSSKGRLHHGSRWKTSQFHKSWKLLKHLKSFRNKAAFVFVFSSELVPHRAAGFPWLDNFSSKFFFKHGHKNKTPKLKLFFVCLSSLLPQCDDCQFSLCPGMEHMLKRITKCAAKTDQYPHSNILYSYL